MAGVNRLVVGCLPPDIAEDELQTVFSTYGEVVGIEVQGEEDPATGLRRAHVSYRETKSAEDAITVLHEQYKIRTDAERPIQVWWFKEEASSAGGAPAGGDWAGAAPGQDNSSGWGATSPAAAGGAGAGAPPAAAGAGADGGQARPSPPEDGHKLFVGGLPEDITEEEMRTVFGTYGEVMHVHIMKPNSMTGLRGAFIFYSKKESGEDAIKVLNDTYKIRTDAQAPIQVRWAKDGKGEGKGQTEETINKIFVGSLPPDVTEEEIRTVFSTYGEVTNVRLMAPHAKTGNRACLVFYARRGAGEDAIKVLNEVYKFREDSESPIQVKWGREKEDWKGAKGGKGGKGWDGGWGGDSWGGSSGGWSGGKGGGKGWQALGGGGWQDRSGGGSWWQDASSGWGEGWRDGGWGGSSKGWGGDSWGGGKGGKGDKGGYYDKGGKGDKGGYGKGYGKGDKGGDKGYGGDKGGYGKGKSGDKGGEDTTGKLFVANLPEDIQDNALEYVFGTYGKVQKVHIMSNNSRNGAVAAFVEFGTAEEAETAIASLNEKYEIRPGYGPIVVRHANARRPRPY